MTKPIPAVPLLCQRAMYIADLLQIKDKFHCQESITDMGCPLTRECEQKKIQFSFSKSVHVPLQEIDCLWECANTEFDWEVKRDLKRHP